MWECIGAASSVLPEAVSCHDGLCEWTQDYMPGAPYVPGDLIFIVIAKWLCLCMIRFCFIT